MCCDKGTASFNDAAPSNVVLQATPCYLIIMILVNGLLGITLAFCEAYT